MSSEISPAPAQQSRSRVPILISWVLILGLAGLIVYGNLRSGESPSTQKLVNDERARMFGMVAVQMKSLQKEAAGTSSLVQERMGGLIKQMESDALTAEDKIRIAILAGESFGAEDALMRLSNIPITTIGREAAADIRSIQVIYGDRAAALSSAAQNDLIQRYGYLGRVALAYGVPPDKEPRKTLQSEALWFTFKLTLVGIGLVILLGLSLAAFAFACAWFLKGKIRPAYIPKTASQGVFLEGFALYLVLFVALGLLIRYVGPLSLQWTWAALVILPIVWIWTGLRGATSEERRQAFGWHRGRGFLREIGAGLGGYIAGLVVIALGCLVTVILIRISGTRATSPIVHELNGGPLRLVGLYALSCVFAPFMEETMFRGLLFHHLRRRWSWAVSAVLVSAIFALLHPQGWVAVPALGAIAMVLAALREWRGSLVAPMAAHAFSNFLVLTLALLFLK